MRTHNRIRGHILDHREFYLLLGLFALFRLSVLVLYRPGGYLVDWWDYKFYFQHAQLVDRGLYPFLDYWMEYPPVFPWLVVWIYQISLLVPSWLDEMFVFATLLGLVLLAFEVGNFALIYRLGETMGDRGGAVRACQVYAALAVPLYYLTGWFDCLPLFFLLLALHLVIRRRATLAGLSIGVGFMIKLMPLLTLPVAFQTLRAPTSPPTPRVGEGSPSLRFGRLRTGPGGGVGARFLHFLWSYRWAGVCMGAALVAVGLIAAPFLIARPDLFAASFVSMNARASWESVWAILDGYFWGGSIVAKWPQRADPATAAVAQHDTSLPWLAISAAFALTYLVLWLRMRDWRDTRRVVAFTGLSTLLFLIYSKGYSPQFLVFVLPFLVLLIPGARGLGYIVLLTANNLAEWPFYHVMFTEHPWFLTWVVAVRTLLFLLLAVEFGLVAYGPIRPTWSDIWRRCSIALAALVALSFVPAAWAAAGDYRADRLAADPYHEAIAHLTTEPAPGDPILFTDRSLHKRFRPYLALSQPRLFQTVAWDDVPLVLDDAATRSLADLAAGPGTLWVVYAGTDADRASNDVLEGWLSTHAYPVETRWFPNCRVTRYATGPDGDPQPLDAVFDDVARLAGAAWAPATARPGDVVRVLLRWQAPADGLPDRTVFVHLRDAAGQTVAQRDAPPVNGFRPTSSWRAGEEVLDRCGVLVPAEAPAGAYSLVVGLYDPATGDRVPLAAGGSEVTIGTVEVQP